MKSLLTWKGCYRAFWGLQCPVSGSGGGDEAVHTAEHLGGSALKTCAFHSIPIIPQFKSYAVGASLVMQWLRICLPVQGTWVRALVREDPTCRGATKPVCHNY